MKHTEAGNPPTPKCPKNCEWYRLYCVVVEERNELSSRLTTAEQERGRLQHIIDCADTPLMRTVMEQRAAAEARVEAAERGLKACHGDREQFRVRAGIAEEALREIAACDPELPGQGVALRSVVLRARAALACPPQQAQSSEGGSGREHLGSAKSTAAPDPEGEK